jgi:predicted GH43/DUF377 family glycosyl hydrolase
MDTHDNGLEWMSLNENEEREELCIYQIDGTEVCLVPKRIKKKGFFLLKSIQKKPKIKTQLSVCVCGKGGGEDFVPMQRIEERHATNSTRI